MKVILLKDIPKIGKKYEVKEVSDGYAMNFLIKNGSAKAATDSSIKNLEELRKVHEQEVKIQEDLLEKTIHELHEKEVIIKAKANEKGHLFAAVHKEDLVSQILKTLNVHLDIKFIEIPKPIKEVGQHEVLIKANNKTASIKILVEAI